MLTTRETLPTLLTFGPGERRLSEFYGSCFALILQLRATTEFGDVEVLRERIERLLRQAEREARQHDVEPQAVRDASFALVAFIDETVQGSQWSQRDAWLDRPLQLERYDRNDAGEEFFTRLDALRARPDEHLDVLEVYYLCMALGFEGRYRLRHQAELRLLIENTYEKLRRHRDGLLAPHALPEEEPMEIVRAALPAWVPLLAALALGVLLYLGLSLYVSGRAADAAGAVRATVEAPIEAVAPPPNAPMPETPAADAPATETPESLAEPAFAPEN